MSQFQPGILQPIPAQACYLNFEVSPQARIQAVIEVLKLINTENTVVGIGQSLLGHLGKSISGMKSMPAQSANGITIPSTPVDLWCWLRGDDRGELLHRARRACQLLSPVFVLKDTLDAFRYADCRDISGYIDGTENPQDDDAIAAAIVSGNDSGLDGSSFVAVQRWRHNLDRFESFSQKHQDDIIGRHREDNVEFDGSPDSAHVKRTAQESFEPEAFMLRRSMPWSKGLETGLMFVAFGASFYSFETQLNRMMGNEDGITDGLFEFSEVRESSYFWCPPVTGNQLLLSSLEN